MSLPVPGASGPKLPVFHELRSVHIVGVCGTLMGAFAAFLKRKGIGVTGSDQNVYPPMSDVLQQAGVRLYSGYSAENLAKVAADTGRMPDLVVIGNVISASNAEAQAVIASGIPYTSLPEAMEKLMLEKTRNLVVAGTHGKTTTSSLLAFTLAHAAKADASRREPCYFIGGVSHDLPFSFNVPDIDAGRPFVLEGDEYDTAFWDKVPKFNHYLPDDVILTSVEYDHADIYPDLEAVKKAFRGLMSRVRGGGKVIACFDYANVREVAKESRAPVLSYASDATKGADYWPENVRFEDGRTRFDVVKKGTKAAALSLQLTGAHNVMNALAVYILCRESGLSDAAIARGLDAFQGVKRRQEVRGEERGVLVIDDFAHHPTAVKETLRALRMKYPRRRLVAVFEPRSATSRRKVFQKEYGEAFLEADEVWISKPYDQTKIAAGDQFSSDQLVADIQDLGRPAHVMATIEEGISAVARSAKSGDLVAVLSNGGFEGFIPKFLAALKT